MGVRLILRPWDSGHLRMDEPAAGPPSVHSAPGASGLLLNAMIANAQSAGKRLLDPGLGINPGVRRFRAPWGGKPFLPHERCRYCPGRPKLFDALLAKR